MAGLAVVLVFVAAAAIVGFFTYLGMREQERLDRARHHREILGDADDDKSLKNQIDDLER